MRSLILNISLILLASSAFAGFTFEPAEKEGFLLKEGDTPIMVYQDQFTKLPKRVDELFKRMGYFHPVYGLDGEIMTQDFPLDHRHHRGIFWSWPQSLAGDRKINIWEMDDARQHLVAAPKFEEVEGKAHLSLEQAWRWDDTPDKDIVGEHIEVVVHPATDLGRAMDFSITLTNLYDQDLKLMGQTTDNKGYGGFSIRPDAQRKPFIFTATDGVVPEDALEYNTPWADISYPTERKGEKLSGAAIFQHGDLPGFPHKGWLFRNYAFLGQSWPHTNPTTLKPGESVTLKYRIYLHRGDAKAGKVAEAYADFVKETAGR